MRSLNEIDREKYRGNKEWVRGSGED